jgi:GxxExxY protein
MKKINLIYAKTSYKLIGLAFEVFNELGYGYKEKYYQKAYEKLLIRDKTKYQREVCAIIKFQNENLAKIYLDFLINNKVIVELKAKDRFLKSNIKQVYSYLKANDLKLGLIFNFTRSGIKHKRILNLYQ